MIRKIVPLLFSPLFYAAMALLSLASAYISQYVFGMHPCILCLYQRIPFALVILLGIVAFLMQKRGYSHRPLLGVMAIAFFVGAGIAFFHSGVEYGWWQGTDACGSPKDIGSVEALRQMIMKAPVAKCSEAAFRFLTLSMAGWNVLWSGGLALLASYTAIRNRNHA